MTSVAALRRLSNSRRTSEAGPRVSNSNDHVAESATLPITLATAAAGAAVRAGATGTVTAERDTTAEAAAASILLQAWTAAQDRAPVCPRFLSGIQQQVAVAGLQLQLLQLLGGPGQQLAQRIGWLAELELQELREVFGGGSAHLALQDPKDLLECGIEITAQPPGKTAKALTLLSGGEKALTAISLLFAIFAFKPSPFCVLDEVDAPLDEANVARFAGMVQRMKADTQFIVITHQKPTMMATDSLYGVTMAEQGISRLVSVQLREAERLV